MRLGVTKVTTRRDSLDPGREALICHKTRHSWTRASASSWMGRWSEAETRNDMIDVTYIGKLTGGMKDEE